MCLFSDEDDHVGFALLNLPFTLSRGHIRSSSSTFVVTERYSRSLMDGGDERETYETRLVLVFSCLSGHRRSLIIHDQEFT